MIKFYANQADTTETPQKLSGCKGENISSAVNKTGFTFAYLVQTGFNWLDTVLQEARSWNATSSKPWQYCL